MGKSTEKNKARTKADIETSESADDARTRLSLEEARFNDQLHDPKNTGWMKSDAP